jgi:ElaB/YqjD/DUF883 family membrane-anchored ribosome-binding protein
MKDERPDEPPPIGEKADELLEVARQRGRGLLDRQKDAAGEELRSVADVMREAAHTFEKRQEGGLADYAEKAAAALERASASLREREIGELVSECETGLRRHPTVWLAATAAAGFALGRLLRAGPKRL